MWSSFVTSLLASSLHRALISNSVVLIATRLRPHGRATQLDNVSSSVWAARVREHVRFGRTRPPDAHRTTACARTPRQLGAQRLSQHLISETQPPRATTTTTTTSERPIGPARPAAIRRHVSFDHHFVLIQAAEHTRTHTHICAPKLSPVDVRLFACISTFQVTYAAAGRVLCLRACVLWE